MKNYKPGVWQESAGSDIQLGWKGKGRCYMYSRLPFKRPCKIGSSICCCSRLSVHHIVSWGLRQ